MENNTKVKSRLETVKDFFKSKNFLKPFGGITLGGLAGFLYYYYVGCSTGSCAITSNPLMSTIYGGLFGLFIVSSPCSRGKC